MIDYKICSENISLSGVREGEGERESDARVGRAPLKRRAHTLFPSCFPPSTTYGNTVPVFLFWESPCSLTDV